MPTFTVQRKSDDGKKTRGTLIVLDADGSALMRLPTLELPWNGNENGLSCIPAGEYPCAITWSNRFARLMPRLYGVPERQGILIHSGNTTADTEGCILVGSTETTAGVANSRAAFLRFFSWLGQAARDGQVICSVKPMLQGV